MSAHEMTQLSLQVDQLMKIVDSLQSENQLLRHKVATYIQENARLQHRNERASTQLKQVIKQMKEQLA